MPHAVTVAHAAPAAIGLVEDEPVLREELSFQLQHRGFAVAAFADAAGLYRHLVTQPLAAVVLDIGLPGEDGLSIARLLRAPNPHIGLVFLTARSQRDDRLGGLAAGADAYLVKPVDMDELDLILQRLLQRHALSTPAPAPQPGPDADSAPWTLQASRAQLLAPSGTTVRLTLTELQLLAELTTRQGRPCKHVEMARAMGLLADEWDRHRLEVIVSRLRAKVERETGLTAPIRSVRGVGYAWDCDCAP